jgi:ATP phosphoribosyltransferase
VVDITTTGATLAANGLKVLDDGLILSSQAHVAAALTATWDDGLLDVCRRLLSILAARARGKSIASLAWPPRFDDRARAAVAGLAVPGDSVGPSEVLVHGSNLFGASHALALAGVGPVSVSQPAFVFEATNAAVDRLADRLSRA